MKRLSLLVALLLIGLSGAHAQFGSFGDVPIEINSDDTRFEGGVAVADRNVVIRYGDTVIYCDFAQYNPDTRDVLVSGNVRIFRTGQQFTGERALYNLETKVLRAADFRGSFPPFAFGGDSLGSQGSNVYLVKEGIFTTSDSSKPDYVIKARTVRIYPNDRIIFQNARFYVGRTPIFWFPYLYQSLSKEQGFALSPGYSNTLGAYLLTQYFFPIGQNVAGTLRLDLMSDRGIGLGFDARWQEGAAAASDNNLTSLTETNSQASERERQPGKSWGRFRSYIIDDSDPGMNKTAQRREEIDSVRYRVSLQDRTYWTDDIYSTVDINKLSDRRFLQDFAPGEFRQNPNPDNAISVTKWSENYTFTLTGRAQLNTDMDGTEKLPEGALDIKRQPIFGKSGIFYDSDTSAGYYRRNFADGSIFPDYDAFRADTFHQFSYPGTYFGWLSLVPKLGIRGTYYSDSGSTENITTLRDITDVIIDPATGEPLVDPVTGLTQTQTRTITTTEQQLRFNGALARAVVNGGLEASFKFSKAYEQSQSRAWGLDGLRHVVQPYMNASFVYSSRDPEEILQFDRINRSTQPPPLDFPQFNTIDSIDNWSIVRLGVRNRLQTRRDNLTFNWLELDTFFDVNIDRPDFGALIPDDGGTFSNVFNRLRWVPLPWVNFALDSQIPLIDEGFWQVNTNTSFKITRNVQLSIGNRYISGSNRFQNSNLLSVGGYLRLGEHWGFSFRENYEFTDSTLESQRYELHRDLSSWVASLGVVILDNGGGVNTSGNNNTTEYGLLLTFTLKDIPGVRIPLALDPEGTVGGSSGRSR
jgi:hypothetical protein